MKTPTQRIALLSLASLTLGCSDDIGTATGTGSASGDSGDTAVTTNVTTGSMTMGPTGEGEGSGSTAGLDDTSSGGGDGTSTGIGSGSSAGDDSSGSAGTGSSSGSGSGSGSSSDSGFSSSSSGDGSSSSTDGGSSGSESGSSSSSDSSSGSGTTGGSAEIPGFVGMSTDDSLRVFDQATDAPVGGAIDLLPEGNYPYDVTIHPDGTTVWVAGASGDGMVVLDTSSYAILSQSGFSTGADTYAVDIAFSPDGATAYVAGRDAEAVILVDAADFTEISVEATPGSVDAGKMAVNPCNGLVYVVEWFGDELLTYDPSDGTWTSLDIGSGSLWDLAIDPTGTSLYVLDRSNDVVHVFDVSAGLPAAFPPTVAVGDDPWGVDITSDGQTVVVACEDDNTVHFIDTAALTASSITLPADADPRDVDITEDDAVAYVTTGTVAAGDGVYIIDMATQTMAGSVVLPPSANANSLAVKPQPVTCVEP